jgi:hypothetical protein
MLNLAIFSFFYCFAFFLELNAKLCYFFFFLLFCFFLQFSFHAIWELFRHILNCVEPESLNMAIFAIYHESKVSLVFLDVNFTLPHTYFHVKWQNMAIFLFRSCWTVMVLGFSRNCLDTEIII